MQESPNQSDSFPDLPLIQFSRYEVRDFLGTGGMGAVYQAFDKEMEREVALKVILPKKNTLEPTSRKPKHWEAIISGKLQHPGIVSTYDTFMAEDRCVIVMEFFEGIGVDKYIDERKGLDLPRAVSIISQACDALEYAHGKGVIHKDIKPSNLLINTAGQVKILDFGIAEFLPMTPSAVTLPKELFEGTPAYSSPEVIRQQDLDRRTDIFSLGIVFYELLTGKHPFRGETISERLYGILSLTPSPSSELHPGLPQAFDTILARALAKNRDLRYPTMRALKADVDNYQALDYFLKQKAQLASEKSLRKASVAAGPPKRAEILVVDDDSDILQLVDTVLKAKGFGVTCAGGAEIAFEHLKEKLPDVVISDINMPGMDGLQFCVRIRSESRLGRLPFIFLTANKEPMDRVRGFEVGADDYIMKPFHPKELLHRIEYVLLKYRKMQEEETLALEMAQPLSACPSLEASELTQTDFETQPIVGGLGKLMKLVDQVESLEVISKEFWNLKQDILNLPKAKLTGEFLCEPLMKKCLDLLSKMQFEEAYSFLELLLAVEPSHKEGLRLKERLEEALLPFYTGKIGSLSQVPSPNTGSTDWASVQSPTAAYLISRTDGKTPLKTLIQMSPSGKFETYRSLYSLKKMGFFVFGEKKAPTVVRSSKSP